MSKEEILAAIAQAVETGTIGECDTGFVTTIKTINNKGLKFFVGEQSDYDALTEEQKSNLFAIITNDTSLNGIKDAIETLKTRVEDLENNVQALETRLGNGEIVVGKAAHADEAYLLAQGYTALVKADIQNFTPNNRVYVFVFTAEDKYSMTTTVLLPLPFYNDNQRSAECARGEYIIYNPSATNKLTFYTMSNVSYSPSQIWYREI